ncbi:MAG TPA: molybdopterin molybdotransferase MoeA [Oscillospiraceae bacterium]|nr:molybdopterin molybdotransferase MoeA [Oscillospiraceae bacterium]
MIAFEQAQKILCQEIERLLANTNNVEQLSLWQAGDRVLAQDIVAADNVPAFDRSLVDGFALLAADTEGATAEQPITLPVTATVAAGARAAKALLPKTAVRIFTGALLPDGTDCVVKEEKVIVTDEAIVLKHEEDKGEGISFKGEDIALGEHLLSCGTRLAPADLAILATLGIDPVPVFKQPEVGIFSTGNELVDVNCSLQPGQLRASNLYVLAELVRQAGGVPVNLGLVGDSEEEVLAVYAEAEERDLPLILSTGGTASGDYDVIKAAMDKFSGGRLFNKVAMRPGAPVVVSAGSRQLLIGLSGNPAGATVAMLLLIAPLIARLAGNKHFLRRQQARLTQPIFYRSALRGFFWGNYDQQADNIYVTPHVNQFCASIKTYVQSNCLIEAADGHNIERNQLVTIFPW